MKNRERNGNHERHRKYKDGHTKHYCKQEKDCKTKLTLYPMLVISCTSLQHGQSGCVNITPIAQIVHVHVHVDPWDMRVERTATTGPHPSPKFLSFAILS